MTADEIIRRCERKYRDILRAHLLGENPFPLVFPVGRLSTTLVQRRQQIEELRRRSKDATGLGYRLEWATTNQRDLGRQTTPSRAVIDTLDDYLDLIRKREEYAAYVSDIARIRARIPALEGWMQQYPQSVVENAGRWDDLLTVCRYFMQHPRPNLYLRELPIPVHTKFIEQNSRILRDLLDVLLPSDAVRTAENAFNRRYGLSESPLLIRVRLLDRQFEAQFGPCLNDLTLPADQLSHLLTDHLRPRTIIVTENLVTFLTLPAYAGCVGLFGRGFAVQQLAILDWLQHCRIIYWGDIDAHGFQILSDLRMRFPHVSSVMMDRQTLEDHAAYVVDGSALKVERFDTLTSSEAQCAQHVVANNLRLEQEHIPHAYALHRLNQAVVDDR
jgi:hypothetical protein